MSAPQHWAQIGEAGFLGGMRALVWVNRVFGRTLFRIALYPVLGYFFLVRGSARRASLDYLRRLQARHRLFDREPGPCMAWRHFLSFAEALLDKVLAMGGAYTLADVDLVGQDAVLPLLAARRGAVMLTAHVGNLEVCQALAELQPGLKLNILMHLRNATKFNRLLDRQRLAHVRVLAVDEITPGTAVDLQARIEAGEMLVIAADRPTPGSARRVHHAPFLGAPAPFPQGPFILASLLRCPVFAVWCTRRGTRFRIDFELLAGRLERQRGAPANGLGPAIEAYAASLERQCVAAPLQWFNFHDFWANPQVISPAGPDEPRRVA
ncbi:MAG: hypothetical protein IT479_01040 [Xanthomonadales bacterium]|nr:hypothetical protein [Xanthomonadales bacterium]MCC6591834.1 hypothetical protein [Xanthomonadales bacterium]MCE7931434.1 hypothetical protein [Xanthomonadales bacterium PRO6]